jgi:hypothetical protein
MPEFGVSPLCFAPGDDMSEATQSLELCANVVDILGD